MRFIAVIVGAAALVVTAQPATAQQRERTQEQERRARVERAEQDARARAGAAVRAFTYGAARSDRAAIGVTMGDADERGVPIAEVSEDGPAARAGLRVGDRLVAVGDVSLRLDADEADDPMMRAAVVRRLTRAMARLDVGDAVSLRVASAAGEERTERITTVRADQIAGAPRPPGATALTVMPGARRASLGLSVTSTGTDRDTLGAFVVTVVPDGPAEQAGVYEGARVAAVNGVDLRVDAADVEDRLVGRAKAERLERELRGVEPGDDVTLRVYENGRYRDVRIRAEPASEVYGEGFQWWGPGAGGVRLGPGATMVLPPSARAPRAVQPPRSTRAMTIAPPARLRAAPRAPSPPSRAIRIERPVAPRVWHF